MKAPISAQLHAEYERLQFESTQLASQLVGVLSEPDSDISTTEVSNRRATTISGCEALHRLEYPIDEELETDGKYYASRQKDELIVNPPRNIP
ncbi:hypothetical protein BJY52DRAFT_1190787 [Lactarius psammicola]|nr:hypothetical protein BJY52DRAFT_1190787 [Lactarius psammicola]